MAEKELIDVDFPTKMLRLFDGKARYRIAHGGRGCIHKDTLIDTPDGQVKVSEFRGGLVKAMTPQGVQSVYAGPAIKYQKEDLYRVEFSDGRSIICTDEHRFLTENGWCQALEVGSKRVVVSAPYHHQTSSGTSPSESQQDARHCFGTILNYLYGYFEGCRQYDEQPRPAPDTFLDVLPLLIGGQQHSSHILSRADGRGFWSKDNRPALSRHLSSLSALLDVAAQGCAASGSCSAPRISELSLGIRQAVQRFHGSNNLDELVQGSCLLFLRFSDAFLNSQAESLQGLGDMLLRDVGDESYSDNFSDSCSRFRHITIKSIELHSRDHYYDFFVPVFNNYLTDGIINHNSGKSWSFARELILRSTEQYDFRVLCCRELQKSIKDSVHYLLVSQIHKMGLSQWFTITDTSIKNVWGAEFLFYGLRTNADQIKSLEDADIAWVEEAHGVSDASWELLIPTIRKPGSEIWVSMNPDQETDPSYQRFIANTPRRAKIEQVNYTDNPWFGEPLLGEMLELQESDPDAYEHVWLGRPRARTANQLISIEWLVHALHHQHEPDGSLPIIKISADISDGGKDKTIITVARCYEGHTEILRQTSHQWPSSLPVMPPRR